MSRRSTRFTSIAKVTLAGAFALSLNACAPIPDSGLAQGPWFPPGSPPDDRPLVSPLVAIASVEYAAGDAFIIRSGSAERTPATEGLPLYPDDRFLTENGMMRLRTAEGGEIIVYPGTDPRLFKDAACFAVSFFNKGRLRITAHEVCVNGEVKQGSTVGYVSEGGVLSVFVLEGRVTLLVPPFGTVEAGESVVIRGGQARRSEFRRERFESLFPSTQSPVIL